MDKRTQRPWSGHVLKNGLHKSNSDFSTGERPTSGHVSKNGLHKSNSDFSMGDRPRSASASRLRSETASSRRKASNRYGSGNVRSTTDLMRRDAAPENLRGTTTTHGNSLQRPKSAGVGRLAPSHAPGKSLWTLPDQSNFDLLPGKGRLMTAHELPWLSASLNASKGATPDMSVDGKHLGSSSLAIDSERLESEEGNPWCSLYVWGCNERGQCGIGTHRPYVSRPKRLPKKFKHVSDVVGCDSYNFVVGDGKLHIWGTVPEGVTGTAASSSSSGPAVVDAAEETPDDQPVAASRIAPVRVMNSLHTKCIVRRGDGDCAAITTERGLVSWRLPDADPDAVQHGRTHGQRHGSEDLSIPAQVSSLRGMELVGLACGPQHTLAVSSSGALFGWGSNEFGQLGVSGGESKEGSGHVPQLDSPRAVQVQLAGDERALLVACGHQHSLVLTTARLLACGANTAGQLGDEGAVVFIHKRACGLQPVTHSFERSRIKDVKAGGNSSMCLLEDGLAFSWGDNRHGQLGQGSRECRSLPAVIGSFEEMNVRVRQLSLSERCAAAVSTAGNVYTWGQLRGPTSAESHCQLVPRLVELFAARNVRIEAVWSGSGHQFVAAVRPITSQAQINYLVPHSPECIAYGPGIGVTEQLGGQKKQVRDALPEGVSTNFAGEWQEFTVKLRNFAGDEVTSRGWTLHADMEATVQSSQSSSAATTLATGMSSTASRASLELLDTNPQLCVQDNEDGTFSLKYKVHSTGRYSVRVRMMSFDHLLSSGSKDPKRGKKPTVAELQSCTVDAAHLVDIKGSPFRVSVGERPNPLDWALYGEDCPWTAGKELALELKSSLEEVERSSSMRRVQLCVKLERSPERFATHRLTSTEAQSKVKRKCLSDFDISCLAYAAGHYRLSVHGCYCHGCQGIERLTLCDHAFPLIQTASLTLLPGRLSTEFSTIIVQSGHSTEFHRVNEPTSIRLQLQDAFHNPIVDSQEVAIELRLVRQGDEVGAGMDIPDYSLACVDPGRGLWNLKFTCPALGSLSVGVLRKSREEGGAAEHVTGSPVALTFSPRDPSELLGLSDVSVRWSADGTCQEAGSELPTFAMGTPLCLRIDMQDCTGLPLDMAWIAQEYAFDPTQFQPLMGVRLVELATDGSLRSVVLDLSVDDLQLVPGTPGVLELRTAPTTRTGCFQVSLTMSSARSGLGSSELGSPLFASIVGKTTFQFHVHRRLEIAASISAGFHFWFEFPHDIPDDAAELNWSTDLLAHGDEDSLLEGVVSLPYVRDNGAFWSITAGQPGRLPAARGVLPDRGNRSDISRRRPRQLLCVNFDPEEELLQTLLGHAQSLCSSIPETSVVARVRTVALLLLSSFGGDLWNEAASEEIPRTKVGRDGTIRCTTVRAGEGAKLISTLARSNPNLSYSKEIRRFRCVLFKWVCDGLGIPCSIHCGESQSSRAVCAVTDTAGVTHCISIDLFNPPFMVDLVVE